MPRIRASTIGAPAILLVALAASVATTVERRRGAAAPHLIVFAWPGTDSVIRLESWDENARFLNSLVPTGAPGSQRRQIRDSLVVGMFWGPGTVQRLALGIAKSRWAPSSAETQGTLYLATAEAPAVLVFRRGWQGSRGNVLGDSATAILHRHRVPTRARTVTR